MATKVFLAIYLLLVAGLFAWLVLPTRGLSAWEATMRDRGCGIGFRTYEWTFGWQRELPKLRGWMCPDTGGRVHYFGRPR